MKTQSIHWNHGNEHRRGSGPPANTGWRSVPGHAGRELAAASVILGIIAGAAWVLTVPALYPFVQAAIWAASFKCFTAAIRAGNSRARGYLLIGSGLMAFALSSMTAAPGFAFMALMLLAVWVAALLYRK